MKEVVKEMIKSEDISLNETSDKKISKNELIKYLREMKNRSIDRSKNRVFWNCPDMLKEYKGEARAYSHIIDLIESGKFDK